MLLSSIWAERVDSEQRDSAAGHVNKRQLAVVVMGTCCLGQYVA